MLYVVNDVASEGAVNRLLLNSGNELPVGTQGVVQQQYAAGSAIANTTTETSLFTPALFVPQSSGYTSGVSAPTVIGIPANSLLLGVQGRIKVWGRITNTGTPTLRTRLVLRNTAGTIVYTLADTGAVATSAITGTTEYYADFEIICSGVGTTGSITSRGSHTYGTTASANTRVNQAPAAVTVDTTQQYALDLLVTWGTANASNSITPMFGIVEVL